MHETPHRDTFNDAVLAEHIRQTFPLSLSGFLAKEHFWALGDRSDIARATAGRLFMELCFPVKLRGRRDTLPLEPATLGLAVSTRQAETVPYAPVDVAGMGVSRRAWAHLEYSKNGKGFWMNTQPITDAVIQVESVVSAATDPTISNKASFSNKAMEALIAFGAELVEFPERPALPNR